MHVIFAYGDIAQAGGFEIAAPLAAVGPLQLGCGFAQADVIEFRIAIFRNPAVTRHRYRIVAKIGEQRTGRIAGTVVEFMTGRAITFIRIFKQTQAAHFCRTQFNSPADIVIVPGAERGHFIAAQKGLQRTAGSLGRLCRTLKYGGSELHTHIERIRLLQLARQLAGVAVIHFQRIEQRTLHLLHQGIGPAIPKEAAKWNRRQCIVILIEKTRRRIAQIQNRGRVARTQAGRATAERHTDP